MISCKVLVKNHNEPNESVNYNVFNNNNNDNDKILLLLLLLLLLLIMMTIIK